MKADNKKEISREVTCKERIEKGGSFPLNEKAIREAFDANKLVHVIFIPRRPIPNYANNKVVFKYPFHTEVK